MQYIKNNNNNLKQKCMYDTVEIDCGVNRVIACHTI